MNICIVLTKVQTQAFLFHFAVVFARAIVVISGNGHQSFIFIDFLSCVRNLRFVLSELFRCTETYHPCTYDCDISAKSGTFENVCGISEPWFLGKAYIKNSEGRSLDADGSRGGDHHIRRKLVDAVCEGEGLVRGTAAVPLYHRTQGVFVSRPRAAGLKLGALRAPGVGASQRDGSTRRTHLVEGRGW